MRSGMARFWVGVSVVGLVAGMSGVGWGEGAATQAGGTVLRTPEGMNIDGGVLLEHGKRVARYGGLLNTDGKVYEGKSYLDVVEVGARQVSAVWQSGEIGSGYPVFQAAFSADGRVAIYDALDWNHQGHSELGVVRLKEAGDSSVTVLKEADGWGQALAISADGTRGASHTRGNDEDVWDLTTGEKVVTVDAGGVVGAAALDSAGKRLVVGTQKPGEKSVQIWDAQSGRKLFDCTGQTGGTVWAAVSADDSKAATADSDGFVWIWSMETGKALARLESGGVRIEGVAWSADGKRVAAVTDEGEAAGGKTWERKIRGRLWDVATAGEVARWERTGMSVQSVAISADGERVITYGEGHVEAWDVPRDLPAPRVDKEALAAGAITDGEVARFDFTGGWAVDFSADGKRVGVGGVRGFNSWDIATGQAEVAWEGGLLLGWLDMKHDVGGMQRNAQGHGVATIVRLSTGEELARADLLGFPYVDAVALSGDGRVLALAGGTDKARVAAEFEPRLAIVDAATGGALCSVTEHIDSVQCMAFSPEGKVLYSASGWYDEGTLKDAAVHAVDVATGKEKATFGKLQEAPVAMCVSADGKAVWVLGGGGLVQRFDAATGRELARGEALAQARSLAVSPDGKMAAVGLYDHRIVLVDGATGKVVRTLRKHEDAVMGVAFSGDGKRLASVSLDKTVRVWDLGAAPVK